MLNKIGVKKIINAMGTMTLLGGNRIVPEALDAMNEVANVFVDMEELSRKAGAYISKLVGSTDAYITNGAAAGLNLAISAAMTEGDLHKMTRLPSTEGMKNRVVLQQPHTIGNSYYHLLEISGARLVIVGSNYHIDTADLENAINRNVAAIVHFLYEPQEPEIPLDEVIKIAHRNNIPVIVDAAAELPPSNNLKLLISKGVDAVVFSGGKDIGAPSDTGVILGCNYELIQNCRKLGPLSYLEVNGERRTFIGRVLKVSKEDIVAFTASFERYLNIDHNKRLEEMNSIANLIIKFLKENFPEMVIKKSVNRVGERIRPVIVPKVEITLPDGLAERCCKLLKYSDPAVYTNFDSNHLIISTHTILDEELDSLLSALVKVLREVPRQNS